MRKVRLLVGRFLGTKWLLRILTSLVELLGGSRAQAEEAGYWRHALEGFFCSFAFWLAGSEQLGLKHPPPQVLFYHSPETGQNKGIEVFDTEQKYRFTFFYAKYFATMTGDKQYLLQK